MASHEKQEHEIWTRSDFAKAFEYAMYKEELRRDASPLQAQTQEGNPTPDEG